MAELKIPLPDSFQDEIKDMFRMAASQAIDEAVQRERIAKDWMDQKTACEYLGISFGTLQNFRRLGLKISTVQGKTLVSKKEINRCLEEHQQ